MQALYGPERLIVAAPRQAHPSPSIPIQTRSPSKRVLDGRFWPLWAPPHSPSKLTLDGLLSPTRVRASHLERAAELCLSLLARDRGAETSCDWASIACLPSARPANCSPRSCRAWHAMRGPGGRKRSDPGYLPTQLTLFVVFVI